MSISWMSANEGRTAILVTRIAQIKMTTQSPMFPISRKVPENGGRKATMWHCAGIPVWLKRLKKDPHHVYLIAMQNDVRLGYAEIVRFKRLLMTGEEAMRRGWKYHLQRIFFRVRNKISFWGYHLKRALPAWLKGLDRLSSREEEDWSDDEGDSLDSLSNRIQLVGPDQAHPTTISIHFLQSVFPLNKDELETLAESVRHAECSVASILASHYVAIPYAQMASGQHHLMERKLAHRKGQVLCGCLPPSSEDFILGDSWMLLPYFPPLAATPNCPQCLKKYSDQGHPDLKVVEQQLFGKVE